MPIVTNKNTNYGGDLVTQKYAPLMNIALSAEDKAAYSAMLTNRAKTLRDAQMLPKSLVLRLNWTKATKTENTADQLPPLVVISSNRSDWIKNGIVSGDNRLGALDTDAFANASDLRALTTRKGVTQSPPLYCPARTGLKRSVYIVVHFAEYETYHSALKNTGVTVVGWQFNNTTTSDNMLAGFGASRYAAIEFCKELKRGGAVWNYSWLLDDNVVALTGFAGYAAVEAALAGAPDKVCAGFHGGTKAESFQINSAWADKEMEAGRGGAAPALPVAAAKGIIQQAVCWNITYLLANNLNFSPLYVTSAEDLSLCSYFDSKAIPYFYYTGIGVRKEVPYPDDSIGAKRVNQARQTCATKFAAAENAVQVQPIDGADGGVQTLTNFIVNRVLPNSQMADRAGDVGVQNTATCQAVEQITCAAIASKWVTDTALDDTFKINADAQPQVVKVDT